MRICNLLISIYSHISVILMKVLKFGAVWCKECIVMRPLWQEIEEEIPELETEYFDLDESPEKKQEVNITKAPTFVFLDKDNQEILRLVGPQNKKDLVKLVKEHIDK